MACVNEKGQLNQTAVTILEQIRTTALTAEEISKQAGIPLFKVRSQLRELKHVNFVTETEGQFKVNPEATIPWP